eukprot:CAMPEP_0181060026 /NCGR_PEP_ID=MMETSP1070-20121207/21727_1 /TAXON_ID=265543 /ORGANISM="Minutocellus polymorphus, Strain NH13" /LENGTH=34 /DNA_ID= /DNA_START= /DNA_END= /DNA_ORIENTATION=
MVRVQCRHELAKNGRKFDKKEWDERHWRRAKVWG